MGGRESDSLADAPPPSLPAGITTQLHNQCFATLGAWLRTGQTRAASLAGTPVLASAFAALANDELFDNAVDVVVDIIHETQELQENVAVIQEIVPRLTALGPSVADPATREDEDKMRGFCRILVEAGEWYEPLIVQHPDTFLRLVDLIKQCATVDELDVVSITLNFWYRLSKGLQKMAPAPIPDALLRVFVDLVGIVIKHLHYPDDSTPLSGEERDTFRDFRHKIGDTLKDCCAVLGAGPCLERAYDIIAAAVSSGSARWQDVEAPLFSMRSMGAAIDIYDDVLVPKIMEMLPKLPAHPRIRYAAILVIGRYTHWTQQHPQHIQFQLPYVSSGFDDNDPEVLAAASQTMKYLCKDCPEHLVAFLPQLHSFIQTVSGKLGAQDLLDLSAAIAHIIVAMPPHEIASALSTFVMPDVELLHSLSGADAPKEQVRRANDALERIDVYLAIIGRVPDLPPSCAATCQQVWSVLDAFIARYGSSASTADRACVAIRRGLVFFDELAFAVAPSILDRLASAFETTPVAGYLWITGKVIDQFAAQRDPAFDGVVQRAFERESAKLFSLLQSTPPSQVPDGGWGPGVRCSDHALTPAPAPARSARRLHAPRPHPDRLVAGPHLPVARLPLCPPICPHRPHPPLCPRRHHRARRPPCRGRPRRPLGRPARPALFARPARLFPGLCRRDSRRRRVDGRAGDPALARCARRRRRGRAVQRPHDPPPFVDPVPDPLGAHRAACRRALARPRRKRSRKGRLSRALQRVRRCFLPVFARICSPSHPTLRSAISAVNPNQVKDAFTWLLRTSRKSRDRARELGDRSA